MKRIAEITGVEGSKIPAIKSIRNLTGLGLKEAKAVVDELINTGKPQSIEILHKEFTKEQVAQIMSAGSVSYTYVHNTIHETLKDALIAAVDIDKMEVAEYIFKALKANSENKD